VTVRPQQLHDEEDGLAALSPIRGGKWTMVVVLRLRGRTLRFSQLQREIGVTQKTLTVTLRGLERDGFVSRTSYATIPPRVDYALTELGAEASAVLEMWEEFARKHRAVVEDARRRFDASSSR
jgi:DNA-binding HxlR family transcriptional regulator